MVGWGQCRPILALAGLRGGEWALAPGEHVDANTTAFAVDVTEIECASGQEAGDRLHPPLISYDEYRVIVVFTLIPPDGEEFTCQSNPSTRIQVELRESLGDRSSSTGRARRGRTSGNARRAS